jgi:hypothetical protein
MPKRKKEQIYSVINRIDKMGVDFVQTIFELIDFKLLCSFKLIGTF